jgi:hypothetical protein
MFPGAYNITLVRGSTFSVIGLQLLGGSGPFDLTGFTCQSQVRVQPGEDVILDLEPVVSDAVSGMVELTTLTDEETSLFPIGVYHWDFLLVDVYNEVFGPIVVGQFYIVDKVTDS